MPSSFPNVCFPFLWCHCRAERVSRIPLLVAVYSPDHAEKMHELPDEYLADALPIAKKIAIAQDVENYNILQVRVAISASPVPLSLRPPIRSAAIWTSSDLVGICDRTMGVSHIRYDKR